MCRAPTAEPCQRAVCAVRFRQCDAMELVQPSPSGRCVAALPLTARVRAILLAALNVGTSGNATRTTRRPTVSASSVAQGIAARTPTTPTQPGVLRAMLGACVCVSRIRMPAPRRAVRRPWTARLQTQTAKAGVQATSATGPVTFGLLRAGQTTFVNACAAIEGSAPATIRFPDRGTSGEQPPLRCSSRGSHRRTGV